MEKLHAYYRDRLKAWVGLIVLLAFAYKLTLAPAILDYAKLHVSSNHYLWVESVTKFVETALVGVLFLTGEWFIRKHLWRWENSSLDFGGNWKGTTTYGTVEKDSSTDPAAGLVPFDSKHGVRIEQDCLSIKIAPDNKGFATWSSLAMNIVGENRIGYAYEVTYTDPKRFPPEAIGYEQMDVVKRKGHLLRRQRPNELSGKFYHCAKGTVPLYRGTVVFARVD